MQRPPLLSPKLPSAPNPPWLAPGHSGLLLGKRFTGMRCFIPPSCGFWGAGGASGGAQNSPCCRAGQTNSCFSLLKVRTQHCELLGALVTPVRSPGSKCSRRTRSAARVRDANPEPMMDRSAGALSCRCGVRGPEPRTSPLNTRPLYLEIIS